MVDAIPAEQDENSEKTEDQKHPKKTSEELTAEENQSVTEDGVVIEASPAIAVKEANYKNKTPSDENPQSNELESQSLASGVITSYDTAVQFSGFNHELSTLGPLSLRQEQVEEAAPKSGRLRFDGDLANRLSNLLAQQDIVRIRKPTDDYGDSVSSARLITLNTNVSGVINAAYDRDFYGVDLEGGTEYAIAYRGTPTDGGTMDDPRIYGVLDANGTIVSSGNDDGGIGYDSLLFFTPTSTQTYYFDFGGYDSSNGTFTVSVTEAGSQLNGNNNSNTINGTNNSDYLNAGYDGNDTLNGMGGDDYLIAYNGNDTLNGGAGHDIIQGGEGADTFVMDQTDAMDTVVDFSLFDGDKLDLSGIITGYTQGVSDVNEFIRFENRGGHTIVQVDSNGSVGGENFVDIAKLMYLNDVIFPDITNVDVSDIELAVDVSDAITLTQDVRLTENLNYNENDFYEVTLTGGTKYALSVQGASTGEGTSTVPIIKGVYDVNGQALSAGDTYGGVGNDALLFYTPGSTGTYYFQVSSGYTGSYSIELTQGGNSTSGNNNNNTINGTNNTDYLDAGYNGNDVLNGLGGDDYLEARNGNDRLNGGAGQDFLAGGNGSDKFIFDQTDAMDTIADFTLNQGDHLDLDALLSGYTRGVSDVNDFIRFENRGSDTIVQVDGNGSVGGESFIDIAKLVNLNDLTFANEADVDANNIFLTNTADPDGNIASAIALTQDVRLTNTIDNSDFTDRDFYEVTLTGGTKYALSVQGASTGQGTSLYPVINGVYDSNGNYIAVGDTYGGIGNDSLLFYTPGSTGTYYFDIGSSYEGSYSIELTQGGNSTSGNNNNNTINGTNNTDYLFAGYSGNDTLNGLGGNDYLEAYNGDDRLNGGAGQDFLAGGNGSDKFIFDQIDAMDTVTDFYLHHGDHLDLDALLSGYTQGVSDVNEFIRFENRGNDTIVQVDGNGSVGGENFIDIAKLLDVNNVTFANEANVDANNIFLTNTGDSDGNISGAIALTQDVRLTNTIDNSDFTDRDFYEVTLTGGTKYALSVQGASTGQGTSLYPVINGVYDSNGNYIAVGDTYGGIGNDSLLFYTPGSTGTYYFDIGSSYEGSYSIELTQGGNSTSGNNNNNTINGTNNTDYLFAGYSGNDTLNGLGGNDYLEAYNGDDRLNGGAGQDFLTGGNGADTFIFDQTDAMDTITDFQIYDGDQLDFSSILSGYDPMTDLIEEFIQVTSSGNDVIVSVDTDGGADNFQDIALLLNTNAFDVAAYEGTAVLTM